MTITQWADTRAVDTDRVARRSSHAENLLQRFVDRIGFVAIGSRGRVKSEIYVETRNPLIFRAFVQRLKLTLCGNVELRRAGQALRNFDS
jgi:hypothetical protein